jgi:hypothetical protein
LNKPLIKSIALSFAFLVVTNKVYCQQMSLSSYDSTRIHFGFTFGINYANLSVQPVSNLSSHFNDTLKGIHTHGQSGFNLALQAEFKITKSIHLLFSPDLAFSERDLIYSFAGVDTFTVLQRVESTFLDFPLDIKLLSKRFNKTQLYILGGAKYTIDLAAQRNANQQTASYAVPLKQDDIAYEAGAGVQFFFRSFRLGIDAKYSMGTQNLLKPDNTIYTQSIESLHSQLFLLSFTFGN